MNQADERNAKVKEGIHERPAPRGIADSERRFCIQQAVHKQTNRGVMQLPVYSNFIEIHDRGDLLEILL